MYRLGVAWQNSSYNQPPHLGYYLPAYLGVDGDTYTTQTANHAPESVTGVKGVKAQTSNDIGQTTKKIISNDQLVIVKDGKEYNAVGQTLK